MSYEDLEARRRLELEAILAGLGVTAPEASLFHVIQYGLTLKPAAVADRASWPDYSMVGPHSEEACRAALEDCLEKGWLQLIDEERVAAIAAELRSKQVMGPIYRLPEPGGIDFTLAGAALWLTILGRRESFSRPPFAYTDGVEEKTTRYFPTLAAARAEMGELRELDDLVSVEGPFPIGPWRAQWWRRFPEGYRLEVEQRRKWEGRAGGGEERCYLVLKGQEIDLDRLRGVLDRRHMTLEQWLLMICLELPDFGRSAKTLCGHAAQFARRRAGLSMTAKQCLGGLEECLRQGWLRIENREAMEEVERLLCEDPVVLAVPGIARRRPTGLFYEDDPLQPGRRIAKLESRAVGAVDFSPAGAALYRDLMGEWLGDGWEDRLDVCVRRSWEVHHYCETEAGFTGVGDDEIARGHIVTARRIVPIGPWCVFWWMRFPAGFRLELEFSFC